MFDTMWSGNLCRRLFPPRLLSFDFPLQVPTSAPCKPYPYARTNLQPSYLAYIYGYMYDRRENHVFILAKRELLIKPAK